MAKNRLSISGIPDELRAMVFGAEAIGISKDELQKSFAEAITQITEKKLGKHKEDALQFRKADLERQIAELQKETKAIDGMLTKE
jgi:hypothetical protein